VEELDRNSFGNDTKTAMFAHDATTQVACA
jgi:hypothetical protein